MYVQCPLTELIYSYHITISQYYVTRILNTFTNTRCLIVPINRLITIDYTQQQQHYIYICIGKTKQFITEIHNRENKREIEGTKERHELQNEIP